MNRVGGWTALALVGAALGAGAEENPSFQASFLPDAAMYPRTQRIEGITLSVWGENPQAAFSLGFVNGATGESSGLCLGLVNYAETYAGAQWALVNVTEANDSGWQGGPLFGLVGSVLNYTGGDMSGVQTGIVNLSKKLSGVQVGIVNYTQYADKGVQVGVVNVIAQNSGWFTNWPNEVAPGMILVNWRF